MNRESRLDVTETRRGLTLVICVLVVLGYLILQYLGGTGQAPVVEVRTEVETEPPATPHTVLREAEERPHVLRIESDDAPPGHAQRVPRVGSELR